MNIESYTGEIRGYIDTILEIHMDAPEKSSKLCRTLSSIARKEQDFLLLGFSHYYLAEAYFFHSDTTRALSTLMKGVKYLIKTDDYSLLARSYNLIGVIYDTFGNLPSAMESYFLALSYSQKKNDLHMQGILHQNIATAYFNLQDYSTAIKHYKCALKAYRSVPSETGVHSNRTPCLSELGQCYCKLGNRKQACHVHMQLEKIMQKEGTTRFLSTVYLFMIYYYLLCNNQEQVDYYVHECVLNAANTTAFISQADDYQTLARILIDTGRFHAFRALFHILEERTNGSNVIWFSFQNTQIWLSYLNKIKQTMSEETLDAEVAKDFSETYQKTLERYYELSEQQHQEDFQIAYNIMKIRLAYDTAFRRQKSLEKKSAQLRKQSEIDEMTGLANRARLNIYLDEALEASYQTQQPLGICMLDIDRFKNYNDTYGHMAGDHCISVLASELKAMISEKIFCARYGGDEFIIIYTGMTKEEIYEQSNALRLRMLAHQIPHRSSDVCPFVSISQGIAYRIPKDETRSWDYLHIADQALYDLKRHGRNDIKIYG